MQYVKPADAPVSRIRRCESVSKLVDFDLGPLTKAHRFACSAWSKVLDFGMSLASARLARFCFM